MFEALGEVDDRRDEVPAGGFGGEVADELDVDLEVSDGESLEIGEAAEAGAEVIERDRAAECVQPAGEPFARVDVVHQCCLGELEDDAGGVG
ncbi:MAG TPA: hypothetical protein VNR66_13780, partial [Solirubrobacteraceae bacterium]|nr:hypothetical protein [Solirubrobacteraceae bacterium]